MLFISLIFKVVKLLIILTSLKMESQEFAIISNMKNKEVNGWEIGIPILQIVSVVVIYAIAIMIQWNSHKDVSNDMSYVIFSVQLLLIYKAFRLYRNSNINDVRFSKLGVIFSLFVPVVLLYMHFFF